MSDNQNHEGDGTPLKKAKFETMSSDEDDENLTYDQQREKRLKKNMDMFEVLGINKAAEALANSIKKKPSSKASLPKIIQKKDVMTKPSRRSQRLANIPPEILTETNHPNQNIINKESPESMLDKDSIPIPEEDSEYFEKLSTDLAIKKAVNDFHTCDFVKFTNVVKSLENYEIPKIAKSRIYSLAIHPSESSLIIAAGDMKGNIALVLSVGTNQMELRDYQVHDKPVNCISFCTWDSYKLFSTSHDGSVRCGDIVKRTFDIIYTADSHTTWHTEYERNLLIGNGSGHVDLIDTRTPNKINNTVWCHERSVRTVHCHPLQNHYFLTSSGIGEASLWDIRNMTDQKINPVLQFEHSRSLTSAFFSASGTSMVSTSNDNIIRLFNTSNLNTKATKPIKKIEHDNHTGRWLSVFKAKWNPGRDDSFFVGSMEVPKRIQIYRSNGNLLHNLTSPNMQTYCPVIEVHPTQAIYVGGNASGRIHIFRTKEQL